MSRDGILVDLIVDIHTMCEMRSVMTHSVSHTQLCQVPKTGTGMSYGLWLVFVRRSISSPLPRNWTRYFYRDQSHKWRLIDAILYVRVKTVRVSL